MGSELRMAIVTACPTGVALTYMAADRLAAAAGRLGIAVKIETQGALGSTDTLTRKDLTRASVAVLAADVPIDGADRFQALPILRVPTSEAIADPEGVLTRALALAESGRA